MLNELNYNVYSVPRASRGGGVAIIARDHLRLVVAKRKTSPSSFELIEATLSGAHLRKTLLSVVYRPPSSSAASFTREFEEYLALKSRQALPHLIVGDFNIHIEDDTDPLANTFEGILADACWHQHVDVATHRNGGTLDLVLTRDDEVPLTEIAVNTYPLSDHHLTTARFHIGKPNRPKTKTIIARKMKNIDIEEFKRWLDTSALGEIPPNALDTCIKLYNDTLRQYLNEVAPEEEVNIRNPESPPWYNLKCRTAKAERRKAERTYRNLLKSSDNGQELKRAWTAYKIEMKNAAHTILSERRNFNQRKLEQHAENPAAAHRIVNKLLGKQKTPTDLPTKFSETELPEQFNRFFKCKVETIYDRIKEENKTHEQLPALSEITTTSSAGKFSKFALVSDQELCSIIKGMNCTHCDSDPIPTTMVVELLPQLLPFLSAIVNKSLQKGSFPRHLKTALVRPSYKKKGLDPDDLSSYRPISNLSFLSKLVEKCAAVQLSKHLEEHCLLPSAQSAYRPNHSTETALLRVVNDLMMITDKKSKAILVLLDLSAAFDTIHHKTLLEKMERHYNITGRALSWFKSYLEDRQAITKIGRNTSTPVDIQIGVPQGSILGPLLFIMYTKEIQAIAHHHGLSVELYADDTQLYLSFTADKLAALEETIQQCLSHIKVWMSKNFLCLNPGKTEILIVSNRNDRNPDPSALQVLPNNQPIRPATDARNLGVIMDCKLNFSRHVSQVVKKCNTNLLNLWKIGSMLPRKLKIQLVNSLIHSHIDYCNGLLKGLAKKDVDRLQKIQNAAVRFIFSKGSYRGTTALRKKVHFLPVQQRIEFKLCFMTHKVVHGSAPEHLSSLITKRPRKTRSLRLDNDTTLLAKCHANYKSSSGAYSVAAPAAWNSLPRSLRETSSLSSFRAELKTHLFKRAYNL